MIYLSKEKKNIAETKLVCVNTLKFSEFPDRLIAVLFFLTRYVLFTRMYVYISVSLASFVCHVFVEWK